MLEEGKEKMQKCKSKILSIEWKKNVYFYIRVQLFCAFG